MNVLYIGYWGANDGLSVATIYPHLKLLCSFDQVNSVVYVSLERNAVNDLYFNVPTHDKLFHLPLFIEKYNNRFLNKLSTFLLTPRRIKSIAVDHGIDLAIARSSLAGVFAHHLWKKMAIPYVVESFEPHAEYMLESGVWSKYGLSYFIQKHWEQTQLRYANGIFPVSNNYKEFLVQKGFEANKIQLVPCSLDMENFRFSVSNRNSMREQLGVSSEDIVGIYVGKFGGIYLEEFAFKIFRWCFEMIPNFFLIILTPMENSLIRSNLADHGITQNYFIRVVDHSRVSEYLSASDFAFALYKPGKSMKFLSPTKIGEYWANGLPVLLTAGTGDDSQIIVENEKGAVFQLKKRSVRKAISKILANLNLADRSYQLAAKYRNINFAYIAYQKVLNSFEKSTAETKKNYDHT